MYLKGISTRRVTKVTEMLCGLKVTSDRVSAEAARLDKDFILFRERPLREIVYLFLDATYLKVRHSGTVIDMACLIAYGVDKEGKRQILGTSMSLSEAEVHWREFLQILASRGLHGMIQITSDDHAGLRAARRAIFPSVPWQRCQFHMSQNAQSYAPRRSMKAEIAQAMRDIFDSPDLERARAMAKSIETKYEKSAPEFAKWLEANIEEGLTGYRLPRAHRKRTRTSNGVERINREIKRRTRVAVMFPNPASALRLVTSVLTEIYEEWVTNREYLDMELLKEPRVIDKEAA